MDTNNESQLLFSSLATDPKSRMLKKGTANSSSLKSISKFQTMAPNADLSMRLSRNTFCSNDVSLTTLNKVSFFTDKAEAYKENTVNDESQSGGSRTISTGQFRTRKDSRPLKHKGLKKQLSSYNSQYTQMKASLKKQGFGQICYV